MFIILFGVTGAGKTTIGLLLAAELGWPFYDADDFHPAANVEKMRQGIPLTDGDRKPWLESLHHLIKTSLDEGKPGVLACSALKESYREYLDVGEGVKYVYLRGDFAVIQQRLAGRVGHYMNPALLRSQFDALEEPRRGETIVSVSQPPAAVVGEIREKLEV
ncbi:MAG: gluconokinase [Cytophagales bacterium]|nr:gluconokinase [Cytophagales bacterium]